MVIFNTRFRITNKKHKSSESTIHKSVCDVNAGPNPTQYNKLNKYKADDKDLNSFRIGRNLSEIRPIYRNEWPGYCT